MVDEGVPWKIASENISVCWVQVLAWFRYVEKWNVILGSDGEKLFERGCIVEAGTKLSFGQVQRSLEALERMLRDSQNVPFTLRREDDDQSKQRGSRGK